MHVYAMLNRYFGKHSLSYISKSEVASWSQVIYHVFLNTVIEPINSQHQEIEENIEGLGAKKASELTEARGNLEI